MGAKEHSLASWFLGFAFPIPVGGILIFYVFLHRAMLIAPEKLWIPFGVFTTIQMLFAPLFYWANRGEARKQAGMPLLHVVSCGYFLALLLAGGYFAGSLGLVAPMTARAFMVGSAVIIPLAFGVVYWVRRQKW